MTSENQHQLTPVSPQDYLQTSLSERLKPTTAKQGTAELLACLTLVAPSGMSNEDRQAWVAVARETLRGIPADLLKRGCDHVRRTCRFASEIVPAIIEEVGSSWERRKRMAAVSEAQYANRHAPRLESKPEYVSAEEMRTLIRSIGSRT